MLMGDAEEKCISQNNIRETGGQMWRTQRVRGNNFNPLVDFVILAEFDIDSGSTVRHIYPRDVPGYKSDWFADFMLPEGAHNRVVDYTYIILNRDAPQIDQHLWLHPASRHPIAAAAPSLTSPSPSFSATADRQFFPADDSTGSADSAKEGKEPSDSAERYMLYGLNIVKTRHDSSVRRGAIVKAMAIFSKYHFIESLKRPLEHAIDRYFEQPERAVLEDLFISLNAVDLRELPRPSYLEQCLMRRGVVFDPDAPRPLDHVPASWTRTITYYRFTGGHGRPSSLKGKEILMRVPLYRTPDEVGDICVMLLVKTFGDAVMRIYHAILMKQRVLFVGYNHAASEVAQMVLSAVAMVAPPLSNIIRRAYPYSNLSDLGFLETPGYIAGVTNPMFQQHDTWWDLLCVLDLPNGAGYVYSPGEDTNRHALLSAMGGRASPTPSIQVHKSASKQSLTNIVGSRFQKLLSHLPLAGSAANAHVASDQKFVSDVVTGINAPLGEEWVRQQFYDYTSSILHLVNDLRSSSPIKAAGVNQSSTSRPPDGRRSIGSEVVPPHPPTSVSPKRSLPGCAPGIADGTNGLDAPAQPAAGSPGAADDSAARLNNEQGGALKLPQHRRFVSDTALNSRDSPSSAPAGASESIKSDTRAVAAVASSPQVAVGVKNSVLDSKKLSTTTAKFIEANRNRVRVLSTSSEVLSMPIHPWAWASMHIRRQSRLSFVQAEKKNEEELYGSSPMAAVARSASAFSVSSNGAASPEKGAEATDANDADAIAIPSGDGAVPLGGEAAGEAGAGASTAATEDTAEDLFPDLDSDRSPPEEHRKHVPPDATQEPDASPTPGLPQAAGAGVEAGAKAKVEAGTSAIDDVRNESRGLEQQIGRGKVGSLEHKLSAADQYDIPITVMNSVSVEDSTAPELQAVKVVSFDERAEQSGKLEDSSNSTLRRLFKDARSNSMSSSFFSDSEEDEDDNDDNDEDVNNFADGDEDAAFDENDDADYDEHDDVVEGAIASAIVQDTDKDTLGILLRKYLRKLQYEKGLIDSESEAPLYFQVLEQFLRSEFDIQALLVMFPESQGGLAVIARGLFHANPVVYYCAVCILQRVQSFDSTRAAFESLSSYYRSAFQCQQQKVESGVWKFEMKQFRRARRKTRIKMAKEQKTALNAAASMPLLTDTGSYGGYGATASSNAGATGGAAAGMGTTRSSFSSLGHEHAGGGNRGTASSTHPPPHSDSNVDLVGAAMGVAVGAAAAGWSVFNSALAAVNPRTSNTTPANSSMGGGVAAGGKATAAAITSNKTQSAETGEAKSSGEKDAAAAADMEGNAPLGTFIQTTLNMIAAAAEPPPNAEENQFDSLELLR